MLNKCLVKDCNNLIRCGRGKWKGYCNKHRLQIQRHNKILDRTVYDKNEIVIFEEVALIFLYNRKGIKISEAIIDVEDVDKIRKYKWSLSHYGYVRASENNNKILLHNIIMSFKSSKKYMLDHIDGNKLNNRKCNLRRCFCSQNLMNSENSRRNKSGVRGVCWDNRRNKLWRAYITVNHKCIDLGGFVNKNKAIEARQEAEEKYFGEFSYKNSRGVQDNKESS